jgi:hypothetical protein
MKTVFREPGAFRDGLQIVAGQLVIGGSGAITSQDIPGATVVRDSAGTYTVTFRDTYKALYGFSGTVVRATATDTIPRLNSALTNGRTITFKIGTIAAPNTGVDPATGSTVLLEFILSAKSRAR